MTTVIDDEAVFFSLSVFVFRFILLNQLLLSAFNITTLESDKSGLNQYAGRYFLIFSSQQQSSLLSLSSP